MGDAGSMRGRNLRNENSERGDMADQRLIALKASLWDTVHP